MKFSAWSSTKWMVAVNFSLQRIDIRLADQSHLNVVMPKLLSCKAETWLNESYPACRLIEEEGVVGPTRGT